VGKFGMGNLFKPRGGVSATEDAEISLHFLVDTFGFSVGLRVVGGGKGEVVVKNSSEFSGERRGELWTTIGDDLVVESVVEEDFVEEKGSDSFGGDGFLSGAENYPLSKAMVYHDQERIKACGGREIGDEIAGDLLEGSRGRGFNRGKWRYGGVCVGFILLAGGAAFYVFSNVGCEARPPEFRSN